MFVLMQVISTTFMGPKLKDDKLHLQNRAKNGPIQRLRNPIRNNILGQGLYQPQTHSLIRPQN